MKCSILLSCLCLFFLAACHLGGGMQSFWVSRSPDNYLGKPEGFFFCNASIYIMASELRHTDREQTLVVTLFDNEVDKYNTRSNRIMQKKMDVISGTLNPSYDWGSEGILTVTFTDKDNPDEEYAFRLNIKELMAEIEK